jgi:uncharacterized protein
MALLTLKKDHAKRIILHAAGLSKRGQFGKGIEAVYKVIEHLGFVQIDTNYVVERAHHHSFFARIPDYKPEWPEQLQSDGRILESWTFAMGYMPTETNRFSIPLRESFAERWKLSQVEKNLMRTILDRIGREGPLMARDFENDRTTKSTGWWDWRPSKVALERMNLTGQLITASRRGFQKVYDLPENIISSDIDMTPPTREEFARHVIRRSLKSLGIGLLKDVAYSCRYVRGNAMKTELAKMVKEGEVIEVVVQGVNAGALYMLPEYKSKKVANSGDLFILSPFDILNIFRHRLKYFFDFDYQVECFVPAPKRKYGYFSLPILVGDTFIARMDSKADRKERVLVINNLHFEKVKLTKVVIDKLADAILKFAKFNGCEGVVLKKTNEKPAGKELMNKIQG